MKNNNQAEQSENLKGSMNVFKKLIQVRKAVPYLQKSSRGHQYQYVGSSAVLGALREELDKQSLLLFPKVIDSKVTISDNKGRQTLLTELTMEFVWVDAETGESYVVPFYAQGIDIGGEKGVGKALTYAEKYFLLKQFNIATDSDDPDAFQNKIDSSTPNFISQEQVNELNGFVNELAGLRNTPADSIFSALKIRGFDRLPSDQYMNIRGMITSWIQNARNEANKNNEQNQQQTNNQPNHQQNNEQQQGNDTPPSFPDSEGSLFTVLSFNTEVSPKDVLFGKLNVKTDTNNDLLILVKDNPQALEALKTVPVNQKVILSIREENGFYFLNEIINLQPAIQVDNNQTGADNVAQNNNQNQKQGSLEQQGNQSTQQNQGQSNNQVFENFHLIKIERGSTPNRLPFAKLLVKNLNDNTESTVFARGDEAFNATQSLVDGQNISMQTRIENGFTLFVALGVQNAS